MLMCLILLLKRGEYYSHLIAILVNWFLNLVSNHQMVFYIFDGIVFSLMIPQIFSWKSCLVRKLQFQVFLLLWVKTVSGKGNWFDPTTPPASRPFCS